MKSTKYEKLAEMYSWEEILVPVGFRHEGTTFEPKPGQPDSGVMIDIWYYPETGHRLRTFDDYPLLYPATSLDHPATKWEVIRTLHFRSNTSLAQVFLDQGGSFSPSKLDEIALVRRDVVMEELGNLSPQDKYFFDPLFKASVDDQLLRQEALVEAKRMLRENQFLNEEKTPPGVNLSEFLDQPDQDEVWRVNNLISRGSTTTVVGARKVGKTTFTYNLLDSYLRGVPFLGFFETAPVEGRIGYVNMELTDNQARRWFKRSPIGPSSRVEVWNLRGQPNPFRSDDSIRDFANEVRSKNIEALFLDPFSGIYAGAERDGMNNEQVKDFLLKLEAFKVRSCVSELVIMVHAGWSGTRSRGASALEDHPDTIIKIEADSKNRRWLSAIGRDVEVADGQLIFDSSTGVLSYKPGGKSGASNDETKSRILELVSSQQGINASEIQLALGGARGHVTEVRKGLVKEAKLQMIKGPRGEMRFYPATSPQPAAASAGGVSVDDAPAFISGAAADTASEGVAQH